MSKVRFSVLDSFRGIAALCVALSHLKFSNVVTDSAFVNHSWLFVDFFFVLSGFVLSHSYFYNGGFKFGPFLKARVARLYPLHLYTLLLFVIFEFLKFFLYEKGWVSFNNPPFEDNNFLTFWQNIFLLQSLNVYDSLSWNTPSWSISAEFYSNLAIAALLLFMALRQGFHRSAFIFIALGVGILSFIFLKQIAGGKLALVMYDWGWLRCFYGFSLGMLAYAVYVHLPRPEKLSRFMLSFIEIFLVIGSIWLITVHKNTNEIFIPLFFSMAIVCFAFEGGLVSALLKKRFFLLSGEISYSLYLNHALVAIVIQKIAGRFVDMDVPGLSLMVTAAYLVIVWGYSFLTYRLVEKPCRQWINKVRKINVSAE